MVDDQMGPNGSDTPQPSRAASAEEGGQQTSRAASADEGGQQPSRAASSDEAHEILARNFWGVLSTIGPDGQPYAVPVTYGFDGAFHVVLRDGRKLENIRANPYVCITVVEVDPLARTWRSVVASGPVELVESSDDVTRAIEALRAQYPGTPTRSGDADALAASGARVMRLVPVKMTGRIRE